MTPLTGQLKHYQAEERFSQLAETFYKEWITAVDPSPAGMQALGDLLRDTYSKGHEDAYKWILEQLGVEVAP